MSTAETQPELAEVNTNFLQIIQTDTAIVLLYNLDCYKYAQLPVSLTAS